MACGPAGRRAHAAAATVDLRGARRVAQLAASDEHGYDGMCYRAMDLKEDMISQYKVEKDSKLTDEQFKAAIKRAGYECSVQVTAEKPAGTADTPKQS